MVRCFFLVNMIFMLMSLSPQRGGAVDLPTIPDAGKSVPGALVSTPDMNAQITTYKGEWSSFASMQGDAEPIFVIAGTLKNTSAAPLSYVKMQFELLDNAGVVLVSDYGYNRQAEALREEVYESGKKTLQEMQITALKAGAEESFRFLFFKVDIPEFHSYRVRIMEARTEAQP